MTYTLLNDLTNAFVAAFSPRHEFDREAISKAMAAALESPAGLRARNCLMDQGDTSAEIAAVVKAARVGDIAGATVVGRSILDTFTRIHGGQAANAA